MPAFTPFHRANVSSLSSFPHRAARSVGFAIVQLALLLTSVQPAMAQPEAPELGLDMLMFRDAEHLASVFEYLAEEQQLRDEQDAEESAPRLASAFQDYTEALGFESLLSHIDSLEFTLEGTEEQEDSGLSSDNDPDRHHVVDPYVRGLLSPQSEMMVGETIHRYEPHGIYLISRERLDALEAVRLGEPVELEEGVAFNAYKTTGTAGQCCFNNHSHSQEKIYQNGQRRIVSKQWVTNNPPIHRIGARTRHYKKKGSGWKRTNADTIEVYGSTGFSNNYCSAGYSQVLFQDYRTHSKKAKDVHGTFNLWDEFWVNTYFDTTHNASDNGDSVTDIMSMCDCREATVSFTLPSSASESAAVWLDGSASEEEDSYFIEIFRTNAFGSNTVSGGYWSSWFNGQAGNINLASHYNFSHSGSGSTVYRVRLGVRNGCTVLEDQVAWISIFSDDFDVTYRSYVKSTGWQGWVYNGATSGTTGQNRRMEAVKIKLLNTGTYNTGICYQAHTKGNGWMSAQCNGNTAGTTGQNRRMEAVKIWLTNPPAGCSVQYRAHVKGQGWKPWVSNGQVAGTTGQNRRMEALQVKLVGSCP